MGDANLGATRIASAFFVGLRSTHRLTSAHRDPLLAGEEQ